MKIKNINIWSTFARTKIEIWTEAEPKLCEETLFESKHF